MRIRNIHLKTIEARRYVELTERPKQVRIDHNSNISHIRVTTDNQATVEFQYTASYGGMGVVKLEGSLLYEDKDAKQVAKEWNDTRKMPNQSASQIHTAIMHACVPEAVVIAKDLGLPPPIPLPQVRMGEKPKQGTIGPEVT